MLAAIGAAPRQIYIDPRATAPEHPWLTICDDVEGPDHRPAHTADRLCSVADLDAERWRITQLPSPVAGRPLGGLVSMSDCQGRPCGPDQWNSSP